jgi:hypothetical protein
MVLSETIPEIVPEIVRTWLEIQAEPIFAVASVRVSDDGVIRQLIEGSSGIP